MMDSKLDPPGATAASTGDSAYRVTRHCNSTETKQRLVLPCERQVFLVKYPGTNDLDIDTSIRNSVANVSS